jgi:cytochrome c-type biogenesis protein CcmH
MRRLLLTVLMLPVLAFGAIDVYEFESVDQEARFRALSDELRCPKCLNTNLSGSDSPIASDLRRTVARMIVEGYSDQEIRDYLLERYGDFILYRPRLTAQTLILWFAPALLLGLGALVVFNMARRTGAEDPGDSLSDEERARLAALGASDGPAGTTDR